MFNLARLGADIVAAHPARVPGVLWTNEDRRKSALGELERGSLKPTLPFLKPSARHRIQHDLAAVFLTPAVAEVFPVVRFRDVAVVMLQHTDGSVYRIHLALDRPYEIERDGWGIELKTKAWVPGMCPLAWLRLHVA